MYVSYSTTNDPYQLASSACDYRYVSSVKPFQFEILLNTTSLYDERVFPNVSQLYTAHQQQILKKSYDRVKSYSKSRIHNPYAKWRV